MKKIIRKIGNFFNIVISNALHWFLVFIFFYYLKFKFKVKIETNGLKLPKEPALYLSNHQTNWDPAFYRCFMPKVVYYMTHDVLYESKILSWVFTSVFKAVKRGTNKNDVGAIKELIKLKKKGKNIGIFPEGGIPYFGETLPIADSIAKLCKKLDMPIVLHRIKGGALIYPRYNKNKAKVRPIVERMRIISREEVQSLSVEELHKIINENLYINEFEFQKQRKLPTKRKNPAESIEKGLYCCPHCKSFGTIRTSKNKITCTNCDFENTVNEYDLLEAEDERFKYFEDYLQWNTFQTDYTKELLLNIADTEKAIISVENLKTKLCEITGAFKNVQEKTGSIAIYKEKVVVKVGDENHTFNYSDINLAYVEFRSALEIKTSEYKIFFENDEISWSAYQVAKVINILKVISNEKSETTIYNFL